MALVSTGFEITASLTDNGGNVSTLTYICDPAVVTDYTEALTARALLATNLNSVTDSTIGKMTIKEVFEEDAFVYPPALVENENKASITVALVGKAQKGNIQIPAPIDGMFIGTAGPTHNVVNTGNASLATYVSMFHPTGPFFISDGDKIATTPNNGMLKGKRISAKNNNG